MLQLLIGFQLFGVEFFKQQEFLVMFFRSSLNLFFILILVRYVYYANSRRKDYLFTYLLISITVFFVSYLLQNVSLQLGFALGFFALFGIIRYRTDTIPIKEMTYLFLVIGISVLNALSDKAISYAELLFANISIIVITAIIEYFWSFKHESSKNILYDNVELIKPKNQVKFIDDLETRTGLKINRVEIGKINFDRGTAEITIYYLWDKYSTNFFESVTFDNFTIKEQETNKKSRK
ncbi:MAG: DUF4956 domain-containing protein [Bacteroidales bacterium]|nr:DUF4956 domain-containing protein [Bacteroidales bacterium]